jgi:hypothetical protein
MTSQILTALLWLSSPIRLKGTDIGLKTPMFLNPRPFLTSDPRIIEPEAFIRAFISVENEPNHGPLESNPHPLLLFL